MHLLLTLIQNLDHTAQVQHPPQRKPQVHGKALSRQTSPSLTPCGAFTEPFRSILPLIPAQCSKIRILSEGSPFTRHLKRERDENEDTTVEEMSQMQEDSQGSFYAFYSPCIQYQNIYLSPSSFFLAALDALPTGTRKYKRTFSLLMSPHSQASARPPFTPADETSQTGCGAHRLRLRINSHPPGHITIQECARAR
jgi:hypothetical protein